MQTAEFRFYTELNDFFSHKQRQKPIKFNFELPGSVKHMIESLGVPHTEIDLILVNEQPVDFSYQVKDKDRISVYPVFESFDINSVMRLHPKLLRDPRFILDGHLGKLAAYLRMLGFDVRYENDSDDAYMAHISEVEKRILMTRDRGLLKRNLVTHGYFIRSNLPRDQLKEIVKRFHLENLIYPFKRCMVCNGLLQPVEKEKILDQLPPRTQEYFDTFQRCASCHKVYWRGSHYQKMTALIQNFLNTDL